MATFEERCKQRKFTRNSCRYYIYRGNEHDLFIALPDYSDLQSRFEIVFDKLAIEPPAIYFKKKKYPLTAAPMLAEDFGYFCIMGKFKGTRGLHKIPLHRLAYLAFYGSIPAGFHIHHIDGNKHNNAAANLVALTEEEHCRVHGRDVRIPKNLFTKSTPKGLFANSSLEPQKFLIDDLFAQLQDIYTEEKLNHFVSQILDGVAEPTTLLQVMCLKLLPQQEKQ